MNIRENENASGPDEIHQQSMESLNSQVVASLQNSPLKPKHFAKSAATSVDLRKNLVGSKLGRGRNSLVDGRASGPATSTNVNRIFDESSLIQEQDSQNQMVSQLVEDNNDYMIDQMEIQEAARLADSNISGENENTNLNDRMEDDEYHSSDYQAQKKGDLVRAADAGVSNQQQAQLKASLAKTKNSNSKR